MTQKGLLTFFCGKMGAGKSTRAKALAQESRAVRIAEDEWLAALYPDQISSFDDYLLHAARLQPVMRSHVQALLTTGTDVVMDFPANTKKQRKWFVDLAKEINAAHRLVFLDVDDTQCLQHIAKRRTEQPERAAFDTEEMFHQVTRYFERPDDGEDLHIILYQTPI